MSFSLTTFLPVVGSAIIGLIYLVYKMQREHNRYTSDLEFFMDQKTISYNKVKANLAVLKTNHKKMANELESLRDEHSSLKEKEVEFDRVIHRNKFLEYKNSEFEKLEEEITNIQETLNGNIKKQLSNYMKEVDGIGERLHKATYDFTENTKSFVFIENDEAA